MPDTSTPTRSAPRLAPSPNSLAAHAQALRDFKVCGGSPFTHAGEGEQTHEAYSVLRIIGIALSSTDDDGHINADILAGAVNGASSLLAIHLFQNEAGQ